MFDNVQNQLDDITNFVNKVANLLTITPSQQPEATVKKEQTSNDSTSETPTSTFIESMNHLNIFNELQYECEYLANKPFKKEIDVSVSDFSRDISTLKNKERRYLSFVRGNNLVLCNVTCIFQPDN